MKKAILLVVCSAVVLFGVGLMLFGIVRQNQQKAIMAVITQLHDDAMEYRKSLVITRTLRDGRTVTFNAKGNPAAREKYITAVDRIRYIDCPQPFRAAWLDFTQTMERADNPLNGMVAFTEGVVAVMKLSPSGTKDAIARMDKLNPNEAFRRVEMVALQYDVQIGDR